jgi:hypothetical protein
LGNATPRTTIAARRARIALLATSPIASLPIPVIPGLPIPVIPGLPIPVIPGLPISIIPRTVGWTDKICLRVLFYKEEQEGKKQNNSNL